MAEEITLVTGIDVELISGSRGEFTVWVNDLCVSKKGPLGYPSPESAAEAVRLALGKST